jgi:hypothetical protein
MEYLPGDRMLRMGLFLFGVVSTIGFSGTAFSVPIKVETVKRQLNVSMILGQTEFNQCAANMVRKAQTLTYTCELEIPQKSKNTKLQGLRSPKILLTNFGGSRREVQVEVSSDARVLSLSTSFDATGLDLELSKFNDDFYAIYGQAAHTIISDALRKQPIQLEVLESKK